MSNTNPSGSPKHMTVGEVIAELEARLVRINRASKPNSPNGFETDDPLTNGIAIGYTEAVCLIKMCRYREKETPGSS